MLDPARTSILRGIAPDGQSPPANGFMFLKDAKEFPKMKNSGKNYFRSDSNLLLQPNWLLTIGAMLLQNLSQLGH